MKKFLAMGCLAILGLAVGGSAKADDFKGPYVGITLGDGIGGSQAKSNTVFSSTGYFGPTDLPAITATGIQTVNPTGFAGGAEVGYNFRLGKIFLGAEADYSAMTLTGSKSGTTVYPCCSPTTFTITQSVSANWLLTARPRVGITMGHLLVYGTGGLAETHIKYNQLFTDTYASAHENAVARQNMTGWTVGGGAEYQFARHLSVKGEYLYVSFGTASATSTNLTAFTPSISYPSNVFTDSDHLHAHVVRAGFNYTF